MTGLSVWAPDKSSVEVELEENGATRIVALDQVGHGWWSTGADADAGTGAGAGAGADAGGGAGAGAGFPPGTRYRYRLDGGPGRPDPRSPSQPEGIDGPSATVDHDAFAWSDQAWRGGVLARAVIYEMHVGTFSPQGTFAGVIGHLDDLVDVGITAIEVLPVAESSGERGWGYDGVLIYAPHHAYGGPDSFKALIDACHQRGVAVILDVVYNHLGPAGNYLGEYGPYFTDKYQTPWGQAVNMDGAGSDQARRFFIDNALMWFRDYHVDGLRLDAVHAIIDESALHFLEQMATEVKALSDHLGRPLWLIAESDRNDPHIFRAHEANGYGLDASWNDDYHHALHAVLTGDQDGYYVDFGTMAQIGKALADGYVFDGQYSPFRDRVHGRPLVNTPLTRLVGCLQNHDQIGNRAVGERSAALMSLGRLRVGAALVLCAPFVPMLFQGEEWAASTPFQYFTDHHDPELGRAVSEGRRGEFSAFGWKPDQVPDPQDPETWRRSVLDWAERDKGDHRLILDWHRDLMALRASRVDLTDGSGATEVQYDESARWLKFRRGDLVIAFNLGSQVAELALGQGTAPPSLLLASDEGIAISVPSSPPAELLLPPDSVAIIELKRERLGVAAW